jgi:hypothetical protein
MLAPTAPTPNAMAQKVRCRQIAESDLGALADLLARGFSRSDRGDWVRGLARMAAMPPVDDLPRFGYVLEQEQNLVGVLLLISSRRPDGRVVANLSSWYVKPAWRSHSTQLVSMTTKNKQVTYLNASPAPHTWRILQALGFKPFNFGRSAAFPVLSFGGGRVCDIIPGDLPEHDMLLAHRAMGCINLVCEKDGAVHPFIFRSRRLERPPVRMMELLYCRATGDFERCGAALGRYFLKQGVPGVLLDGKVSGMISHYVSGKEPRFYKGPAAPLLNDLAFTEKVIFG